MKNKKLNRKGFSLCEVLVAMTIFAIASLVLATMVCTTTSMNKKNYKMNKQMQQQSKAVELEDPTSIKNTTTSPFSIPIQGGDTFNYSINKHDTGTNDDYSNYKYFD